ncbi:hypothetical protein NLJ89_g2551 [Agrocybe chaxingu]|uniref:Cyclin-like domain-containing protein n=1 Tax=Agrocybe chaxingu TaxID=84603 RepID=A0A9W8MYN9_9AGAR|nr:hypothetical protein NLJ89_g2551 [Agrocybe chaxingu]
MPPSSTKHYHPYFTQAEVDFLSEKQRGKQSAAHEEKVRQSACTFLETLGARVGFPRRTIATAQTLYHRFHLFFPRKDFQYHDAALAAVYVSTKMHDTLKKPRELLSVSYAIRYPDLAAKSKHPGGDIDLDTMDHAMVENDRQRLLAIERLILETICFNFTARIPFPYVIKLGKELKASKKHVKLAWRVAIDCHRTTLPLIYPPHVIALGSIYVSALLLSFEKPPSPTRDGEVSTDRLAAKLSSPLEWQENYRARHEDLQGEALHHSVPGHRSAPSCVISEFAHTFLDLLLQFTQQSVSSSTNTSPSTPSSPSPHLVATPGRDRHSLHPHQLQHPYPYKPDQLIRLKIAMRENEAETGHLPAPKRRKISVPSELDSTERIGQNEGTVRFLFFPHGVAGDVV